MIVDREMVKTYLEYSKNTKLSKKQLTELYGEKLVFLFDEQTDTQGFMLPIIDAGICTGVVIAFRGTTDAKDWLTNLNGFHTSHELTIPYDNVKSKIRVHRGFIGAYRSVRNEIHEYLKEMKPISIGVCGHSLGGALATLCAVDLQYNNLGYVQCYPFGNPMVGNKEFVNSYNKRVPETIRTYLRQDLVPKLPPPWVDVFFNQKSTHTGKAHPIGPTNIFYGIIRWFKRKDKKGLFFQELANHSINMYEKFV